MRARAIQVCLFAFFRLRRRLAALACIDDATSIACFGRLASLVLARKQSEHSNLNCSRLGLWIVLAGLLTAAGCAPAGSVGPVEPYRAVSPVTSQDVDEFHQALALVSQLQYRQATVKFKRVLGRFEAGRDATRAAETMFWMGYCYEKQDRLAEADAAYGKLLQKYPATPAAEQARRRLAGISQVGGAP